MERWKKFNEVTGIYDSLEFQAAEIYCDLIDILDISFDKRRDVYNFAKEWLSEEVIDNEKSDHAAKSALNLPIRREKRA